MGDSAPHWFWAELAAQAAGGFAVGLGRDRSVDDLKAIIRRFGAKFAVAQDRETVEKLLRARDEVPDLAKVICWNPSEVEDLQDTALVSFDEVSLAGQSAESSHSGMFEERLARCRGSDPAILQCGSVSGPEVVYTTLTHDNLIAASAAFCAGEPLNASDRWFAAISPEDTAEQVLGLVGSLVSGMSIDCPENRDTARQDLGEIGSTLVCYPSAFWEGLVMNVRGRVEKATLVKRTVSRLASPIGSSLADAKLSGRRPNVFLKLAGGVAEFAFYRPLKARLGLANTRRVYACGPELTPPTMKAMVDMGLNVVQLDASGGTVNIRRNGTVSEPK